MTPNEVAEAARRKVAQDGPEIDATMRAAWDRVWALIEKYWLASNSPDKHYHMAQASRRARLAMLTAYVEGKEVSECEKAAVLESRV